MLRAALGWDAEGDGSGQGPGAAQPCSLLDCCCTRAPSHNHARGRDPLQPLPPIKGFTTIHILPHVDPVDSNNRGMWRNVVKFNPTQKIGPGGAAYSYEDVRGSAGRAGVLM